MFVRYGDLVAVRNLSLSVAPGEIVCVVGANGAGKSTSLLAIAGAQPVWKGSVELGGTNITNNQPETIARQGITLVPEGRRIFGKLTVQENLIIGARKQTTGVELRSDIERLLALFPILRQRWGNSAGSLSGGEQQQLAIARGLMTRPTLMLIDEPSLGLAPQVADEVYALLLSLRARQNLSFLIVEQSIERALEIGDRVCIMRNGEIQLSGVGADVKTSGVIESAYFGVAEK